MSPIRYRERESSSSALAVAVGALAGFATGVLLAQRYGGLAGLSERVRERFLGTHSLLDYLALFERLL